MKHGQGTVAMPKRSTNRRYANRLASGIGDMNVFHKHLLHGIEGIADENKWNTSARQHEPIDDQKGPLEA